MTYGNVSDRIFSADIVDLDHATDLT